MPTVPVNGIDLYYETEGEGEPLLLLPGLGRGTSYYNTVAPLLAAHHRVIRVDPRGIGRSPAGVARLSVEAWAEDFSVLLDRLGVPAAFVVGSSHGGSMAMRLADGYPEKVRALVLFGAFAEIDRFIEINVRLRMTLATKLGMGEEIRDFIALWTFGHELLDRPEADRFLEEGLAAVRSQTPEGYVALCQTMLDWGRQEPTFLERLPHIACPTLVACGDSDYWIPDRFSRRIAECIPGARYVPLPGCGHVPVREQPETAARLITGFFGEARPRHVG